MRELAATFPSVYPRVAVTTEVVNPHQDPNVEGMDNGASGKCLWVTRKALCTIEPLILFLTGSKVKIY